MNGLAQSQFVLPSWALTILACPRCRGDLSYADGMLSCEECNTIGRWEGGIVRFGVPTVDASIAWYKDMDGTHFHERMQIPFTMSSLDTPVYHSYLERLRPSCSESIIVDAGAGDGRNTEPWLAWGYQRVIATDAIISSLARFQSRVHNEHPEWLERLLLVECDVRQLPIASTSAEIVLAIEVLCYLNEDYESGLAECRRILRQGGRIVISERTWEGALLTRLLYGGVQGMLEMRHARDMWDGYGDNLVRSRTFTEHELVAVVEKAGLRPLERKGLSLLSVVFGYLRGQDKLSPADQQYLPVVHELLRILGEKGKARRTHFIVAEKVLEGASGV